MGLYNSGCQKLSIRSVNRKKPRLVWGISSEFSGNWLDRKHFNNWGICHFLRLTEFKRYLCIGCKYKLLLGSGHCSLHVIFFIGCFAAIFSHSVGKLWVRLRKIMSENVRGNCMLTCQDYKFLRDVSFLGAFSEQQVLSCGLSSQLIKMCCVQNLTHAYRSTIQCRPLFYKAGDRHNEWYLVCGL